VRAWRGLDGLSGSIAYEAGGGDLKGEPVIRSYPSGASIDLSGGLWLAIRWVLRRRRLAKLPFSQTCCAKPRGWRRFKQFTVMCQYVATCDEHSVLGCRFFVNASV